MIDGMGDNTVAFHNVRSVASGCPVSQPANNQLNSQPAKRQTTPISMQIIPIKTKRLTENDSLIDSFFEALSFNNTNLQNGDIIAIVSKVVALTEGKLKRATKNASMKKEADLILDTKTQLTLKNGMLVPSAGIDTSNVPDGFVIGWPDNPYASAVNIRKAVLRKYNKMKKIQNLGILIFDSWITPLRNGVTGLALGYSGFHGIEDCRGKKDLYKKSLKITIRNIADNLASAATLVCGEGGESIPFIIIRDAPVFFTSRPIAPSEIRRSPKECLFQTLYPSSMRIKKA